MADRAIDRARGAGAARGAGVAGRRRRCPRMPSLMVCLALATAGCGPIGPIPGGALDGPVGPAEVADWSFASEVEDAQLETRPDDPRSINVWFAWIGGRLYVPTSMILGTHTPMERSWVTQVEEDARVRIRIGETIYERRAVRVPNASDEYVAARAAFEERYDLERSDRDPDRTIWIYRLDPR